MTKRLFIAIELDNTCILKLNNFMQDARQSLLDPACRWVNMRNFHLTLSFLGERLESIIPQITKAMDMGAKEVDRFALHFKGLGCFPSIKMPRVFWVGVENGLQLKALYTILGKHLSAVIALGRSTFSPHLTLARIKDDYQIETPVVLRSLINEFQSRSFGTSNVDKITLFASDLRKSGPIYTALHHSMLQ